MLKRPLFVVLVIAAAYGCASMPGACEPGDSRAKCVADLGPAARTAHWGW